MVAHQLEAARHSTPVSLRTFLTGTSSLRAAVQRRVPVAPQRAALRCEPAGLLPRPPAGPAARRTHSQAQHACLPAPDTPPTTAAAAPRRTHTRTHTACCRRPARMCGIIGVYRSDGSANVELYEGLLMLQHRGQDSAGAPYPTPGSSSARHACAALLQAGSSSAAAGVRSCNAQCSSAQQSSSAATGGPPRTRLGSYTPNVPSCIQPPPLKSHTRNARPIWAPNPLTHPALPHPTRDQYAGMVTTDRNKFYEYKDNGLVKDVFTKQSTLDKLKGVS